MVNWRTTTRRVRDGGENEMETTVPPARVRRGTPNRGARAMTAGVALTALLAAAGCGSSSDSGGSTGSGSSGDKDPIVIGAIAGTTGAYGSTGVAVVNGAKLAVDDINAKGGIDGRKIKLMTANDNASATVSSQAFQKMVSAGAVAITGSPDTGPATVAMSSRLKIPDTGIVDDAGLTIYTDGPTKPPSPWAWSFGLNTFAWGQKAAEYALDNCQGLAVLHDPSTYGEGGNDAIQLTYQKAGKKVALDQAITENWSTGATVGLTSELDKIKASGADCVVVWLTPQDTAAFVQTMHSSGDQFTVIGNDEINADDTFAKLAGQQADGAIGAMLTSNLNPSPELKDFRERYKERFGLESTPFAEGEYDGIMVLADVIKNNGTDPEAIQKGLNSVKDYQGLTVTFSFSEQDHATIQAEDLTTVKYDAAKGEWLPLEGEQ
jgi:ABC-type branched-subunit amino acid transport system substrate-binding protein